MLPLSFFYLKKTYRLVGKISHLYLRESEIGIVLVRLLQALTDACSSKRGKYITIAFWIVIVGLLTAFAPTLSSLYDNSGGQDIPKDADSQVAQQRLLQAFPTSKGTQAILVFYDKQGLTDADRTQLQKVSDWLTSSDKPGSVDQTISVFTVPQAASQLLSSDKTTMTMLVTLSSAANDDKTTMTVKAIRDHVQNELKDTTLETHLTGPAGIVVDTVAIFGSVDLPLLLATVGLVFVLLIILYRSPLLALLPLVAVGVAQQVVNGLLGFAAQAGWFSVSQMATSIATVLLFGAGTDYSIFIASRYREELELVQDRHEAMKRTMHAVGEAITSSAGTVILALLTLLFTAISLYSALGPTLAIAIFVMLLAGLTLVPALVALLGRAAYWPFMPKYQLERATNVSATLKGFWARLGLWTVKHRWLAVVGSTLFLILLSLGNIGSEPSFNFLSAFRVQTDSSRGYSTLQDHFPAGTLAPTTVLLQLKGAKVDAYQNLVQLDAITVALQKVDGVATVSGPTRPDGKKPAIDPATLQNSIAQLPHSLRESIRQGKQAPVTSPTCQPAQGQQPGQPVNQEQQPGQPGSQGQQPGTGNPQCGPTDPQLIATIGAYAGSTRFVSFDNRSVQLNVVLKDDPYSLAGINRITLLRDALQKAVLDNNLGPDQSTQATFNIGGQTSTLADTLGYNQHDTFLVVPAVLILIAIVLALLLRSLIAPLYLLGAVTLNFLASIGVCGFVFQRIQHQDGFNYAIPLYTFIFLVALGADYTIFLMSRVREEVGRHGIELGVPLAVSRTGGVITSAGFILAGTFAVLTILPLNVLYQLGVCVAVGILSDTFIVRGLLVPGLVTILGKWNWWPGKLDTTKGSGLGSAALNDHEQPQTAAKSN